MSNQTPTQVKPSQADLIAFYQAADARMRGLPVHNPVLSVAAVGFTDYHDRQLGVLITPWFMNLVLLPSEDDQWHEQLVGETLNIALPSGQYSFTYAWLDNVGGIANCSLFSPMNDFADQETALAVAEEVMAALFEAENYAPTDLQQAKAEQAAQQQAEEAEQQRLAEKAAARKEQPLSEVQVSRRGFLTGRIRRQPDPVSSDRGDR